MNGILTLKQNIIEIVTAAVREAQQQGKLPAVTLPEVTLEHPQKPEHGDYASSFPLKLARVAKLKPLTIANDIVALMPSVPGVDNITIASVG